MRTRGWIGIGLITIGGVQLAFVVALALYLYLPNLWVKVLVCLLMFCVGALLVYKSKTLASGVLQDIFHRGMR